RRCKFQPYSRTMLITTALFASVTVFIVGGIILWANPSRRVNQAVFLGTLQTAAWLLCWHLTVSVKGQGLFWLKWTNATGALVPISFWLVKESILFGSNPLGLAWLRRGWGWAAVSTVIFVLPFTDYFIPPHSTPLNRVYGWGYYVYMVVDLGLYGLLLYSALKSSRALSGAQRLELQVWLVGGCSMFITIWTLSALSALTKNSSFRYFAPLAVLLAYAGTAFTITAHRIFDARQILLVAVQKLALVASVSAAAYVIYSSLFALPNIFAFLITTVISLWFAAAINGWLNSVFHFYPQATGARQAAFAVARRESRLENLESAFLGILKGWGNTDRALLLSGGKESIRGGGIEITGEAVEVRALRQLRWVTPERLAREKATAERTALARFLELHNLGVLVIGEGPTLTAFIGVGVAASRRPFTYPQVTQLMELASIIESALERAHFSVKAQHAEQLATVGLLGASLAHEIRNPLVSIKTFVQLLPTHHQDPAFRAKFFTLISDEVSRIDRLTEQLLDLASPRAYVAEIIELHPILRASLDLVAAKATDKRIQFLTDFQASPDQAFTDGSAAKQVLLNLCFNAIQAVETRSGDRWVKVSTRNVSSGLEMIVEDSGPGIAPEIRSRLFQPFHSTKSTGFGLGLAICSDILGGLNATITVDSSAPGQGAVFRVTFPCPVLSS
ncbi:MAG TPA: ATP-binding protein, partial [Opitutaceae bacterium]|nr:ATP-binding protein [Opitutaceae bacterium]